MAGNNGYDVIFVEDLPDDLKCIVCHLAFQDPVQIAACGHRFCGKCFEKMNQHYTLRNERFCCPVDRDEINVNQVFSDKAAKRKVLSMKCYCQYKNEGCQWSGELCEMQKHLEEICEFERIRCKQCNDMIERRFHKTHVDSCSCWGDTLTSTDSISSTISSVSSDAGYMEIVMQRMMKMEEKMERALAEKDMEIERLTNELRNTKKEFYMFKMEIESRVDEIEEELVGNFDEKYQTLSSQYLSMKENLEKFENYNSYRSKDSNIESLSNRIVKLENLCPELGVFHWEFHEFALCIVQESRVSSPIFYSHLDGIPLRLNLIWCQRTEHIDIEFDVLCGDRGNDTKNYQMVFNYNVIVTCEGKRGKTISTKLYCNDLRKSVRHPVCLTTKKKNFASMKCLKEISEKSDFSTLNFFCSLRHVITP